MMVELIDAVINLSTYVVQWQMYSAQRLHQRCYDSAEHIHIQIQTILEQHSTNSTCHN